jgi:hypothetical protein
MSDADDSNMKRLKEVTDKLRDRDLLADIQDFFSKLSIAFQMLYLLSHRT